MSNTPLAWQRDVPQKTPWGAYRLTETADGYLLAFHREGGWQPLYEILDFDWQPVDFAVANHYVATHPDSHFRHELMVARTQADVRYMLAGKRLRTVYADGRQA